MSESQILNDVLIAVTALPDALFYRNNSGLFFTRQGRPVRASVPGAADIIGAFRGRAVAIETKTPTGRQSDQQRAFQRAWEKAGGLYLIARSAVDAVHSLEAPP